MSDEGIAAVRDTLARGMGETAFADLKPTDIGKKCVVMARMPIYNSRQSCNSKKADWLRIDHDKSTRTKDYAV